MLKLLSGAGFLDEERVALLLSWRHHTGFSVHNSVTVQPDDGPALERLGRYLLRAPVSLERLRQDEASGEVRYAPKAGHDRPGEDGAEPVEERFDAQEFVARVILQIPDPKRHLTRYYGRYASVVRARRRRQAGSPTGETPAGSEAEGSSATGSVRSAELRRRWANLIRRIYETDPLTCSRCGAPMRIIAFITERPVILKILRHLGKFPAKPRGRGPP